ncbi:hypothetical protein O3P69_002011 [Scylla paramamosain]|uniref:Cuticle protein 6 n=1 Tax=Scylla paramamosain TaxID=85552 RepID=A0AAW0V7X5_SCYPA
MFHGHHVSFLFVCYRRCGSRVMQALLLFLCCVAAQWTAGHSASKVNREYILYAMAPEDRGSYYVNPKGGRYNYGYNTGDGIAKVEVQQPDGSIVGSYRYFDPNGKQVVRSYVADNKGFRVLGKRPAHQSRHADLPHIGSASLHRRRGGHRRI